MQANDLFKTNNYKAFFIVRLILGYVFLVAGLQKFIFPETMGPGRFEDMGYGSPEFTAYFVGSFEVLCALLMLLGLATRLAAIPLIIIMLVAIATTKIPDLADGDFWRFAHRVRLDLSMLLTALFVLISGSDRFSLDHKLFNKRPEE
jgi:putative oxidoreductase